MDINRMLGQSCAPMGADVMKSTIKHPMVCLDLFAHMKVGKRLPVRLEDFQTHSVYISMEMKDSDGNQHDIWIVSTAFNPLQNINDL